MSVKKKKTEGGRVWCRPGNHPAWRNEIAVHFEPGYGICGRCILRRTNRLADYWTKGRALDAPVDAAGRASSSTI